MGRGFQKEHKKHGIEAILVHVLAASVAHRKKKTQMNNNDDLVDVKIQHKPW
jgi:hypothetical protein